ncbi:MAG: hypothetical protein JWP97_3269 [Labilithrix sp.]|nr:hypothetical protein [Labilithrix sp.]
MRHVLALALGSVLSLSGCALAGQSKPARAQETALEMNMNARFGRMEIAVEHVAPQAREAFMTKRRAWGSAVRIADYDMTGLAMKGDDDCETTVRVAWYRASENDLRNTTIKQKWHEFKGDWKLTEESRIEGESGLLGEPPSAAAQATAAPRRAQFPTVVLGTGQGGNIGVADVPPAPAPAAGRADPSAEAVH